MKRDAPKIAFCAGTSWYLWNFRRNVIRYFTEREWRVCLLAPEDAWTERLAALSGANHIPWRVSLDGAAIVEEAGSLCRLHGALRRERPDFVLNHGIKANIYGGLSCRAQSIPYANVVSGLGMRISRPGIFASALARLYTFACSGGAALIVQNSSDLDFLRQNGLSPRVQVRQVMGSGVDLAHFTPEGEPGHGEPCFLFVGRLQEDKGIREFVEAAAMVRRDFPSARFVVVGDAQHANSCAVGHDVLNGWRQQEVVEFVGRQEDVRPWIASATTLVMPSHGGEGMPKVILEAAAAGRPTIASDVPGCRDAVLPGRTGWICAAKDAAALAEAMREALRTDPARLAQMGTTAREWAVEAFSDEEMARVAFELAEASMRRSSSLT
ncbi:glycosyltransferase family 4 protein [Maritimibacter sp. 55A14]|uniref:glycosyltransferase family 4 protein n=1 Tax=Maritimibacter sp. 55A14 TaxID=2174844 RepID=UPI001304F8EC|nr:glycosyltransferase family 4 protein [Maritimibacter sp. 55A14]